MNIQTSAFSIAPLTKTRKLVGLVVIFIHMNNKNQGIDYSLVLGIVMRQPLSNRINKSDLFYRLYATSLSIIFLSLFRFSFEID